MTELQLKSSQLHSGLFLRQLFAIPDLRLSHLQHHRVCTNLSAEQLGGMACALSEQKPATFLQAGRPARLIVRAQALTLDKLLNLQQALEQTIQVQGMRAHKASQHLPDYAVVMDITMADKGVEKSLLQELAMAHQVELNLLTHTVSLKRPGLLLMDMDSTMIAMECIDEIARLAGVGEQVAEVTEQAMQGKLDFAESLRSRVGCLAQADQQILSQVRDAMPVMPGLERLVTVLKQHGWKVALVSGGFTFFADYLKQRLGLDFARANELEIIDGKLSGQVQGDIVDGAVKASTLEQLAQRYGIEQQQTIAMGDGANDLQMMARAGLGVAYKAKPVVLQQADAAIRFGGLDELLYLLES
ncbi:phosphoserine phosphatase SerB [Lacimicrobium sp. SS2-24]|uniref:phosphoserine phosphatase SerB n=1 Tax=Lacimicrobium sp. SS2-24 TaxID=2005569 RepID=UPI001FED3B28|nr:phosphoserine phosphatase SerB [Lacimicrobium sp. SS2-24]